ncbi:MAG: hypothetical protein AAF318_19195 [Pseudomonadota bacterium]
MLKRTFDRNHGDPAPAGEPDAWGERRDRAWHRMADPYEASMSDYRAAPRGYRERAHDPYEAPASHGEFRNLARTIEDMRAVNRPAAPRRQSRSTWLDSVRDTVADEPDPRAADDDAAREIARLEQLVRQLSDRVARLEDAPASRFGAARERAERLPPDERLDPRRAARARAAYHEAAPRPQRAPLREGAPRRLWP